MHYLRDWVAPLRELRRVLKPGGVFALSTHHLGMDFDLSPSGDYFATEVVLDCRSLGEREYEVRFWRRPLSETFRAIGDAASPSTSSASRSRCPSAASGSRRRGSA
jgi:hypothetical protein